MDIAVRRLTTGDEGVARRLVRSFKGGEISATDAGALLANIANYLVVAEAAGDLAGFLLAYRLDRIDRPAGQLFVYEVEVALPWRRRGVGSALMHFARGVVRDERLMEAFVLTSRDNAPAIALYTATGARVEEDAGLCFVYPGDARA
jgi:GNAT superfamily N-acetyltransferase